MPKAPADDEFDPDALTREPPSTPVPPAPGDKPKKPKKKDEPPPPEPIVEARVSVAVPAVPARVRKRAVGNVVYRVWAYGSMKYEGKTYAPGDTITLPDTVGDALECLVRVED